MQTNELPLILASGSASRRELLGRLRLPFEIHPADIDESPLEAEPVEALVTRLSVQKARHVARSSSKTHPQSPVIGSDQVAVFNHQPSGKPGTVDNAVMRLQQFSGQVVTFLTGVCVINRQAEFEEFHLDKTNVHFRELSHAEIERYVDADQPLACAGCFKIESLGPVLFERVVSEDPTALPGLPLLALSGMLRRYGYRLP